MAPAVDDAVDVPLLHIADAVGSEATRRGIGTVGILGTKWVMSERFYAERLAGHGVAAVAPAESRRAELDRIIFDELTVGTITETSRAVFVAAIEDLVAQGAEAVVLACTEIELLIGPEDSPVPVLDSMALHAAAAAEFVLAGA